MRDINAYIQTGTTQTLGFTSTAFQMKRGTPYEGIPVCVRIDDAVCPTSGPIDYTVRLWESDNPTAGFSAVLTYPVFQIGPATTALELTRRYASQKPYVRVTGSPSATAGTNLSVPIEVAVVTGDVT